MCFLLLHHRTRDDAPLVLLANRDEARDRPFDAPTLRDAEWGIVAPTDLRAGGTWLGTNRFGLLVAITNRGFASFDGVRSRGTLVMDVLRHRDAASARAFAAAHLAATAYAGFNLLLADAADAFVIRHPGAQSPRPPKSAEVVALPPGAHVLTNLHDLDEVEVPPLGRPAPEADLDTVLDRLRRLAKDDETVLPGDHRILKRGTTHGTVCSAVLTIRTDGGRTLEFANGVPDRAPFDMVDLG